jgi:cytochrome c-type biogenesis protein CcmH/NrfG
MLRRLLVLFAALLAAATGSSAPQRPRVIVVGWDGADWALLDPLLRAGKLPYLARLVARGRTYDLATFEPMASPLIWTTIATGRTPVDHGVADFQETDPKSRVLLPVTSRSRKVPALWNGAAARGISVGVVGWWATWPAEKVKGVLVSDRAAPVLFNPETLSRSPALTWPEGLADGVRIVLGREGSPGYDDVAKGVAVTREEFEAAVAAARDLADPVTGYRKILGVTRVIGRIALDLYDRERPELLMVYFQGTDEIGHVLGRFRPPRLPGVTDDEARKFGNGVDAFFTEADLLLGEFAARAERDGATLVLLSDHGFRWGTDRPVAFSGVKVETAYLWHRNPGVLVAAGPAVTPGRGRGKASVFDIAPSVARLLGLPPDPAWEGKPVSGIVAKAPPPLPPRSWATFATVERLVPAERPAEERRVADEFTKKLISLGYLTGAEASHVESAAAPPAGRETAMGLANIGSFLRLRGKPSDSISWYRRALDMNPAAPKAWMNLSEANFALGKWSEANEALFSAVRNGYHDPEGAVERRAAEYGKGAARSPAAAARRVSFLKAAVAALPDSVRTKRTLGDALFKARDCEGAAVAFADAVARDGNDILSRNGLGLALFCQGRLGEARRELTQSLALKPDQPEIRSAIALIDATPGASRR